MLTHDEVSGAVIFAGRTDRGAVVLVAEFFRSGIVFVTRSYENMTKTGMKMETDELIKRR